jgi:hypothetical protein
MTDNRMPCVRNTGRAAPIERPGAAPLASCDNNSTPPLMAAALRYALARRGLRLAGRRSTAMRSARNTFSSDWYGTSPRRRHPDCPLRNARHARATIGLEDEFVASILNHASMKMGQLSRDVLALKPRHMLNRVATSFVIAAVWQLSTPLTSAAQTTDVRFVPKFEHATLTRDLTSARRVPFSSLGIAADSAVSKSHRAIIVGAIAGGVVGAVLGTAIGHANRPPCVPTPGGRCAFGTDYSTLYEAGGVASGALLGAWMGSAIAGRSTVSNHGRAQ